MTDLGLSTHSEDGYSEQKCTLPKVVGGSNHPEARRGQQAPGGEHVEIDSHVRLTGPYESAVDPDVLLTEQHALPEQDRQAVDLLG